jgi:rhodanese-related sulfurtransferase
LETQGYVGVGEGTLADIQFGLRFSPALCAIGVALGTILASPIILLVMSATALAGAATPRHPFDLVYNHGVRRLLGKPAIPRNAPPRRFSCGVATVWLAVTVSAFLVGWDGVGYVLGASMAGMAAFVAVTHICLPSLVYTRLFEHVGDVPEVSVEDAWRRMQGGAVTVDVRDAEFWHAGHAPGALNISAAELSVAPLPFGPERAVLVVCQSGVSSLKGAKTLRGAGFAATCSVRGGMGAWLKRGLPLESGSEA